MDGAVGTLKILIEADAGGLTSQLKRATTSITSFVGQMNRQEVNWQKILASTISPAIIGGIASSFALAITEAAGFQNSMITAANNSSTAFTDNMAQAGQAVLGLQSTTGQSSSDIATGLFGAARALGSYSAGQALVSEASAFALTTGINLLDLINALTPVMQQWGITDAGQIKTTIEGLFGAANQGKVPIQELLSTLANTGSVLRTKTDINSAAAALEAFSNQAGNTSTTAVDAFTKIANNTQNVATAADNTVIGMGNWNEQNKTLSESGMAGLLSKMEESLKKMGDDTASILLNHAGFSPADTANIVTADKSYGTLKSSTKQVADNMLVLGQNIENNLSSLDKVKVALGKLKTDFTGVGDFFMGVMTDTLNGIDSAIEGIKGKGTVSLTDFEDALQANIQTIIKNVGNTLSLGTGAGTNLNNFINDVGKMYGNAVAPITPAGTTNTVNNTTNINIAPTAVGAGAATTANSNQQYLMAQGYLSK